MTRSVTRRDRLQYRIDRTFSRGSIAIIFWLGVLSVVLVVAAGAVLALAGIRPGADEPLSLAEATWASLMRTLDPGTMGGDAGWSFRFVMLGVTLVGIFVISTLIGAITSGIEAKLDELGKGRSRVIEEDHTLVLGWSPQVFTVVSELVVANLNRPKARLVILGEEDKATMEDQIEDRVDGTQNTKVICRTGSAIEPGDLDIVSLDTARSVIILSPEQVDPDAEVIKTILAIARRPVDRSEHFHVVAAIRDASNLGAARIAGGDDLRVELVSLSELVARVIAQTCRQSGLSTVYAELLDFAGDEIYFADAPELTGTTFGDALLRFGDSALLGLYRGRKTVSLNPPMDTVIDATDQVIAVSADDDTVVVSEAAGARVQEDAIASPRAATERPEHTLVLGWNWRGPSIIRELDQYVPEDSTVRVVAPDGVDDDARAQCCPSLERLEVRFETADPTSRAVLAALDLVSFDHVVVLAAWDGVAPQRADARTLITLLHLRDLAEERGTDFSIVTEIRDARNQRLAEVTRPDDFVVSERLISRVLTQISEHAALNAVLEDLFDPEGCEVYLKPASDYVHLGQPVTFATVVASARGRGQVAFGYRIVSRRIETDLAQGVVINPRKDSRIAFHEGDRVIVLAEE